MASSLDHRIVHGSAGYTGHGGGPASERVEYNGGRYICKGCWAHQADSIARTRGAVSAVFFFFMEHQVDYQLGCYIQYSSSIFRMGIAATRRR